MTPEPALHTSSVGGREEGVAILVWRRASALEVLLLHRGQFSSDFDGDWAWTTPGGARESREAPADAAVRELFEETRLALDCHRVQSEIASNQPDIDVAVFAAEAPADAAVFLSDEHDRYEWVVPDDLTRCLPTWVHQSYLEVLAKLGLN